MGAEQSHSESSDARTTRASTSSPARQPAPPLIQNDSGLSMGLAGQSVAG
jgi:hypothetical protein